MPSHHSRASETTRGHPRPFIPGTNQIESINYQLRKVTRNRGHFPTEDAAIKLLYLALRNMNPERGGDLGTGTYAWKQALNAFAIHFPGRLPIRPPRPLTQFS